jgi:hypothetical protein
MCPQFEKNPGPNYSGEPVSEGQMAYPSNRIFNLQGKEAAPWMSGLHREKPKLI